MIKLLRKWDGRSSALSLIKVCYTVKAVCHRGPCESAQSLVTPLGIHQRFLMGGMVSLELNLFWRAQCTGQLLQPSPCTVHFKGNRWTVTVKIDELYVVIQVLWQNFNLDFMMLSLFDCRNNTTPHIFVELDFSHSEFGENRVKYIIILEVCI